jgi:hypothetical protein
VCVTPSRRWDILTSMQDPSELLTEEEGTDQPSGDDRNAEWGADGEHERVREVPPGARREPILPRPGARSLRAQSGPGQRQAGPARGLRCCTPDQPRLVLNHGLAECIPGVVRPCQLFRGRRRGAVGGAELGRIGPVAPVPWQRPAALCARRPATVDNADFLRAARGLLPTPSTRSPRSPGSSGSALARSTTTSPDLRVLRVGRSTSEVDAR